MENVKKHFELNGSKGWILSIICAIVLQSVAVGFWAGGVSKDINNIKEDVKEVKQDVKELSQEKD